MSAKARYILIACVLLVGFGLFKPPHTQPTRTAPIAQTHTSAPLAEKAGSTGYDAVDETRYVSPAGIVYGRDLSGKFPSRIAHIMAHTRPDASKPKHSVFSVKTRTDVLKLLDVAWQKRGPPTQQGGARGRDVYDIYLGRRIGTEGERHLRMVMERDSATIITAYPIHISGGR